MDIMELGAIGELVGGVAVIVTLVYLAMGISRNTASVDTARYDAITSGFNDINGAILGDAELPHLFNLGMSDPEQLDVEQRARVAFIFRMYHNQYNKIFRLFRSGILSEVEWAVYAGQWAQLISTPGGAQFLEVNTDFPGLTKAVQPYVGQGAWAMSIDGPG